MHVAITVGEFGQRVADLLPDVVAIDASGGTHPAAWPTADLYILAAEYDTPALAELLDTAAFAWRRPWFPVLLAHPHLRCGPVVIPGAGPCHRCFVRRCRQHAKTPELLDEVQPPSLPGTSTTIRGYATAHVTIAAALARQAIADVLAGRSGTVRTVNLADNAVAKSPVVAVDGCPRCRVRLDPLAELRQFAATLEVAHHG